MGHVNVAPCTCAHAGCYAIDVGWGGGCSLAHMVDAPPHGRYLNLQTWSLPYICYICGIWMHLVSSLVVFQFQLLPLKGGMATYYEFKDSVIT